MYNLMRNIMAFLINMGPLIIIAVLVTAFKKSMRKNATAKRKASAEPPAEKPNRRVVIQANEDISESKGYETWMSNISNPASIEDKENDWLARQMREEDRMLKMSGKHDVIESRAARRAYTSREEYSD